MCKPTTKIHIDKLKTVNLAITGPPFLFEIIVLNFKTTVYVTELLEHRFKEIYFVYHPRVLRVAYYIVKDSDIAEDISQEVFLKLWNKRSELDSIESMEGYLVQMARNEAFNYLEKARQELSGLVKLQLDRVEVEEHSSIDNEEFRKSLEKAVSLLSPKCRLIFSLSRFEGLTNDEIAEFLHISKRTVETQISIALKMFRFDLKHLFKASLLTFFPLTQFFIGI